MIISELFPKAEKSLVALQHLFLPFYTTGRLRIKLIQWNLDFVYFSEWTVSSHQSTVCSWLCHLLPSLLWVGHTAWCPSFLTYTVKTTRNYSEACTCTGFECFLTREQQKGRTSVFSGSLFSVRTSQPIASLVSFVKRQTGWCKYDDMKETPQSALLRP